MSYGWFGDSGTSAIERLVLAIERIRRLAPRRIVDVVAGQVAEQLANEPEALAIVGHGEVRDAARRVVRHRAAELFLRDLLVRHRLDHVRARSRTCSSCLRP